MTDLGNNMDTERTSYFQRNENLELLLKEINQLLAPVEAGVAEKFGSPKYPLVLLVGCARSGTTLMMQWLAKSAAFTYPSNLISRFYEAPYVGAKIQQLLLDPAYNFNNELCDFSADFDFNSRLGKTRGILAPNEFWYFWRRFFKFGDIQYLQDHSLEGVVTDTFLSELSALESVFNKPLVMKAMIINWIIPFIFKKFKRILFVYLRRDPFYNIQSLLESRKHYFGSVDHWYSFKPPEYDSLKSLPAVDQVAGQVFYTNKAIEEGLDKVNRSNWLAVDYEAFCENPNQVADTFKQKFASLNHELNWTTLKQSPYNHTNQVRVSDQMAGQIVKAYEQFSGERKSP